MIKRILVAIIGITVFLCFARYMINSTLGVSIDKNKSRIFVMENKVKLWKAKLKKADEKKAIEYKNLITWASMRKVQLQVENFQAGFLVDQWAIKLAYIGIRTQLQKGFFEREYCHFLREKIKKVSCEDCGEKYQNYFKSLVDSLNKGEQKKVFEISDQLGKLYEKQTKLVENLKG